MKLLTAFCFLISISFSALAVKEEIIRVPYDWSWSLETTIFTPEGKGPFPLIILNHGKEFGDARLQKRYRGYPIAREFTKRGYMVAMPMRLGFSKSDGVYNQYGCDMVKDGYIQAESVAPAVEFFKKRTDVDPTRIVMVGYSYGGVVSIAYGAAYPHTVKGIISLAGGFKKISGGCIWDIELSKAYAEFGSKNKSPQLWIYAKNDSLFTPAMVERMYRSFRQPNVPTRVVILDSFEDDGHKLFEDPDGVDMWLPQVELFFKSLNLPFSIIQ